MIKLENIVVSYHSKKILNQISFALPKGAIWGLIGLSGEGKSTLLRVMGGHQGAQEGNLYFDSKKLPNSSELLIPGFRGVSLVHQDYQLNIYADVEANLKQRMVHLPVSFQNKFIRELLDLVDLGPTLKQKVTTLSGGEQQRLAILCALAEENEVLLLDEPFVHMHLAMRKRVMTYLRQLAEIRQVSILLVSHHGDELAGLCDQLLFLKKGKISRKSSPRDFYYNPKTVGEAEHFGWLNRLEINGKKLWFRPDEFSLVEGEHLIEVKMLRAEWQGPVWHNYFTTENNKTILLINLEPLYGLTHFYVKKKH